MINYNGIQYPKDNANLRNISEKFKNKISHVKG